MCIIEGCDKKVYGRGWCRSHYMRWRRHGNPMAGTRNQRPPGMTVEEAFAWYMPGDPPAEGCWDWTGSTRDRGYGQFGMADGTVLLAHVASHRIYNTHDPITDEKPWVLHWCDRPICVHPAHLHAGTRADNIAEMVERNRQARGERVSNAKLTEDDILWIRANTNSVKVAAMAEKFGVAEAHVYNILRGKRWKHLL